MNKLFPIVLTLLFFSCKPAVIEVVEDVEKLYPGIPIDKKKLTDGFNSSFRNTIYIYINEKNQIFIDDSEVDSIGFKLMIEKRMEDNPKSIFSIKSNSKALMSTLNDIRRWLKDVKALLYNE